MTIVDAICKVLNETKEPLDHKTIYSLIVKKDYYKFGAKDPISIVRGKIRKHCYGLNFPSSSPRKVFVISNKKGKNGVILYEMWNSTNKGQEVLKEIKPVLAEEIIYEQYQKHLSNVKTQLLNYIQTSDSAFFEKLVVDLLLKMGYGWNQTDSGTVVGGIGDEGIDGIINEDKLGLEKIYIQAKRYAEGNNVTSSHIRDFIGAMYIKGAKKGVYFTSSDFTEHAKNHMEKANGMSIILVNGKLLCDYLVQYKIGIQEVGCYTLYEVNNNFFE